MKGVLGMAESRFEELIEALLNDIPDDVEPQSRIEQILLNCIDGNGDEGLLDPHSRIEAYLKALSVKMAGGGSSGGGGGGESSFVSRAIGIIPEYERGTATYNFTIAFETSAVQTT